MTEYLVTWTIHICADSPKEAAKEAHEIQLDQDNIATVFEVSDQNGTSVTIDLEEERWATPRRTWVDRL